MAATDDFGILPRFRGVLVHDRWAPYWCYTEATHAICNAHILEGPRRRGRALVAAPMRSELRPVVELAHAQRRSVEARTIYEGRAGGVEVRIVQNGVGPEPARQVTEWVLGHFEIDHVLVSGIAGGLAPGLAVGSVVVPETVLDLRSGERYTSASMEGVERRGLVATADHLVTDPVQLRDPEAEGVVARAAPQGFPGSVRDSRLRGRGRWRPLGPTSPLDRS